MDMNDDRVAATYGSYLYSGGLAAVGLDRLFDKEKPDFQLLFNGRMAPTRIALELAKKKGIRTIVEERSAVSGRMVLLDDVNCLDVSDVDRLWTQWKDIPLTPNEMTEIFSVLEERRSGGKREVSVFSQGRQKHDDVCNRLKLDTSKPIWVLFTSSVDEIIDRAGLKSVFATQTEWIDKTLAYVRDHPDIQLVIRVHPNVGGATALGENQEDLNYYKELKNTSPGNVSIVQPGDDISSYTLAELCDLALVWYSTIGIETAALGRRVVRGGGFMLEGRDFIATPDSADHYAGLLDGMRQPARSDDLLTIAVGALRFAYIWFLRRSISFPMVAQPEWYVGKPVWNAPAELKPSVEPNLDRICGIFMNDDPIHPPLTDKESRSAEAERGRIAVAIKPYMPIR